IAMASLTAVCRTVGKRTVDPSSSPDALSQEPCRGGAATAGSGGARGPRDAAPTRPPPCLVIVGSRHAEARVERVTDEIPEEVDAQHHEHDGEPWKRGGPPRDLDVLAGVAQGGPPCRRGRLHPKAEE